MSVKRHTDLDELPSSRATPDDLITSFGYNKNNHRHGVPNNYSFGYCEGNEERNNNLFTQYVEPSVYTRSQIIEPISQNIGISHLQQPLPTTYNHETSNFQELDPRNYELQKSSNTYARDAPSPSLHNIYDPRGNGYGDEDRYYFNELAGTNKYYYDDIDAYKKPNFITRTNIDHLPTSSSYGPRSEETNSNEDYAQVANQAYLDNTMMFRTELQQRLMRKRNAELWQSRRYPKRTK
jgi:hypothetical protein